MCGITGIFDARSNRQINKDVLKKMTGELVHRGPDEEGFFIDDGIGFGHRRLKIIDLDGGQQPMQSSCGNITITFNGMIYNYKDLRKKLKDVGHSFISNCDTEVLLYAYKAWGFDMCKYIDGFYAFAIYDANQKLLFAARDPFGKKPFYYKLDIDFFFSFASELTAILPTFENSPKLSATTLDDYFTMGFVPDHRSIYENVHKLPAGHHLIFKKSYDEPKIESFSKLTPSENKSNISYEDAKSKTNDLLFKSVEKRLLADVDIGILLSGGMDSALVTALASKILDQKINSFTAIFSDKDHDESEYAKQISKYFGTNHTEILIDDIDESIIDDIALVSGEPFADAALIPKYLICNKAKNHAKVLLSGDGSDEMFFGYGRYSSFDFQENIKNFFPSSYGKFLFQTLGNYYPQSEFVPKKLRLGATFESLGRDRSDGYLRNFAISRGVTLDKIYTEDFRKKRNPGRTHLLLNKYFKDAGYLKNPLKQAQYVDLKLWLAGRMLVKSDRASMSASTELRSPFLDHELAQFILSLPIDYLYKKNNTKHLLREVATPYLPEGYLNRPKKGFTFPLANMIRTVWYDRINSVIHDSTFADMGIFKTKELRKILKEHSRKTYDHSRLLWAILQFDAFLNISKGF